MQFIFGYGLYKLLKFNQNRYRRFRENRHIALYGPYEGPLLLEIKRLD
jgi:hypothetical protein